MIDNKYNLPHGGSVVSMRSERKEEIVVLEEWRKREKEYNVQENLSL